jgi:hypothetical protein
MRSLRTAVGAGDDPDYTAETTAVAVPTSAEPQKVCAREVVGHEKGHIVQPGRAARST